MSSITIERIATGGDGVGRLEDGVTVFVPRTAPGDSVDAEIVERKQRFARGRLRQVLRASPQRVDPPCPHYRDDRCGGCQLQHLSAEAQLAAKRQMVADALRRIGGRTHDVEQTVSSPRAWRYRSKITLAVKSDVIGLHREGDPASVFPLQDCLITRESLMQAWSMLRSQRALLPKGLVSLVLREDREGGLHVIAEGGSWPWDPSPVAQLLGRARRVSIWWKPPGGAVRVVAGSQTGYPATAFEQVNPELGADIRSAAVKGLGPIANLTVWDLYGGVGDTARALRGLGARVWSVDADRSAIEWAERSGDGVRYLAGRVEDLLDKLPQPDAVVVNPPRGGLDSRVTARLDRWATEKRGARLAYVSCDPATLARDLKRMPALRIIAVTPYDLFPQTAHVESLAVLEAA